MARVEAVAGRPDSDTPDTPRAAYGLLPRPLTAGIVAWLTGLAALAWVATVRQTGSMSDMVSGLGQVGGRLPNDMAVPVFLGMWVGMMVAMMFPTVVPMVLAHRLVVRRRREGAAPTVAFVGGYLAVWAVIGLVPLLAFLGFRNLASDAGDSRWLPAVAGTVLLTAGVYQFTAWKALCLRACRTPLTFVLHHDFGGGARSAFRAGLSHGAYCVGCCWALMAVLVVVGLMNLAWMALLALVFLAEKHWHHAVGLTRVVGVTLVLLGLAVIANPSLLPTISGVGEDPPATAEHMGHMP